MTRQSAPQRARHRPRTSGLIVTAAVGLLLLQPVDVRAAVTHLKPGAVPPPIALKTLAGTRLTLEDARGRPLLVVFGELYHEKTLEACEQIREAVASEALGGQSVATMLVIAQDAPLKELRSRATDPRLPAAIVHDDKRKAYADYRVTVMPSVVVLDSNGKVVHALAGYNTRFKDIVTDALLVALGKLSRERFEQALHPVTESIDETQLRAARLTRLASQLVRRGLPELAEEKYRESLELAPNHVPARLGLAMIMLQSGQLAQAEAELRSTLAVEPSSVDAALGLAYIQTLRGIDELPELRRIVRDLLAGKPDEPRAHYLMGLIHERMNEPDEAIAAFRLASELLMSRHEAWNLTPGAAGPTTSPPIIRPPGTGPGTSDDGRYP